MQTALVTGASSGIGRACAIGLADKGLAVCLTARRKERLEEVAAQIAAKHGADRAVCIPGDVTDAKARRELLDRLMARWGRLDVLVNSAGAALPGAVEDADLDAVARQFELNTLSPLAWMQLVGPVMRSQRAGRIINISSISGRVAIPGLGLYAASKFALEALSDAARLEYRPWGVHVALIEPGAIVTEIWQRSQELADELIPNWKASPFSELYEAQRKHAEDLQDGAGPSPQIVVKAVCHAALARRPKPRYCMPATTRILALLSDLLPTTWRDRLLRRLLKLNDRRD